MHYYKRHIGDYAKKTGRLTMLEHGAYTLLIDACYDRERFPTRDEAIEWAWARTPQEIEAVDFVLSRFFDLVDSLYVQKRIQEEVDGYHGNSATNKRIAIEREEKRRQRARSVNEASPDVHEAPPNHKPVTINQEPLSSVAKATGAEAPLTPQEIIYTYGLTLLVNAGIPDKQARSFFGGLIKTHGGDAVVDKLRECLRAKPLQPLEWLAAALPPKGAPPKRNKQELLEDSNRAVALRFIENMENQDEPI